MSYAQQGANLQQVDSTFRPGDTVYHKDTLLIQHIKVLPQSFHDADANYLMLQEANGVDSAFNLLLAYKKNYSKKTNPFGLFHKQILKQKSDLAIYRIEQRFSLKDKDGLFYGIVFLIFMSAFINTVYPQYFPKIISQFSQSSLRMLQNREQLLQNSFASLVLNIAFVLSFSFMSTLLIFNGHLLPIDFWTAFLYVSLFFAILYIGKLISLVIVGFAFNARELIQSYIFVVFMVNKVLGILLIPFVLILAFAKPYWHPFAEYGAGFLALLLFGYRYLFSLTSVRNKLRISSFHFFLYLCAFEILPLLILYKIIVQYFGGTY
jgi:hypothetical protein